MDPTARPLNRSAYGSLQVEDAIPVPSAGTAALPVSPITELSEVWFKAIGYCTASSCF